MRESKKGRYGDSDGVVMMAAFGLSVVEVEVLGFLVRFVVSFVVLVVVLVDGTTLVDGALGPDMSDELAVLRAPAGSEPRCSPSALR